MWEFNLLKRAKEKNTKKYKNKLNPKDTSVGLRHLAPFTLRSAELEALRGGNVEDQVKSNWDGLKLNLGTIGGLVGGAAAGAAAGYGIGDKDNSALGTTIGAITGALGGGWLGNYLTFKCMANNRGVDSSYGLRHLTPLGMPAQVAALQGYDADAQVESNVDNLLLSGGAIAGGLLGSSAGGPVGGVSGYIAGDLGAYKLLKDKRVVYADDDDVSDEN